MPEIVKVDCAIEGPTYGQKDHLQCVCSVSEPVSHWEQISPAATGGRREGSKKVGGVRGRA